MLNDDAMRVHIARWAGAALITGALAGLAAYFSAVGLEKADKLSSVIGVFVALTGLALTLSDRSVSTRSWRGRGSPAHGNAMRPGETLPPGRSLTSASGAYSFTYQTDGNLVLYRNQDNHPLWDSGTARTSTRVCIMQHDGNLVIYDAEGQVPFRSDTHGNPGSHLVVQDDGNVVVYRPDGTPIWDTEHRPR